MVVDTVEYRTLSDGLQWSVVVCDGLSSLSGLCGGA